MDKPWRRQQKITGHEDRLQSRSADWRTRRVDVLMASTKRTIARQRQTVEWRVVITRRPSDSDQSVDRWSTRPSSYRQPLVAAAHKDRSCSISAGSQSPVMAILHARCKIVLMSFRNITVIFYCLTMKHTHIGQVSRLYESMHNTHLHRQKSSSKYVKIYEQNKSRYKTKIVSPC